MPESKGDKFPWIVGAVIVFAVVGIIIYAYIRIAEPTPQGIKKFFWTLGIILGVLAVVFAGVYFVSKHFSKSSTAESPKQPVHTDTALKIWKEEMMKWNGIPYFIEHWGDADIKPLFDNAVDIQRIFSHVDPSGQTSDKFLSFQAMIRRGRKVGSVVASIQVDLGEEYIRRNWNEWLDQGRLFDNSKLGSKALPRTSGKSYLERLNMKGLELLSEGYTAGEVAEVIDPFRTGATYSKQEPEVVVKPGAKKTPAISDAFPQFAESTEEEDFGEVAEDIEAFRRSNK